MKKKSMIFAIFTLLLTIILSSCGGNNVGSNNQKISNKTVQGNTNSLSKTNIISNDFDKDGIPNTAEKVLGTDPRNSDTDGDGINDKVDKNPTFADNFISSVGKSGLQINKILVENNVDAKTGKIASDHLEVFATNTTNNPITNLTLYYKDIDNSGATNSQSYIIPLKGLILKSNKKTSINIDISGKPGHYRANPNSIYYLDKNGQTFEVTLNAKGYNAVTKTIKKDPGGTELAD